ncbi:hypothetical protein GCM10010347_61780 [Streptomyces cirratus]|uniref:Uncharacterized protein n=1 Tax=Streptomyces cirratus TaxID=68187 RepID=A0ABQ3F4L3_9ACTN|nr:hypothetical protein GCM10010347_61780 [Streptomyces cirratus]
MASTLHHRTVLRTALAGTAARQFISAGPFLISATRETITTPPPNVYSSRHRFPRVRKGVRCTRTRQGRVGAAHAEMATGRQRAGGQCPQAGERASGPVRLLLEGGQV